MISINVYCAACRLKKAWVFLWFIKDIYYQVEKEVKVKTNLKNVVSKEYHDFLNVFSKKYLDILSLHQKYNHKIHPKED